MTSERTQAYGRVVKTLEDLGPSKLQPHEQELIRDLENRARSVQGVEDVENLLHLPGAEAPMHGKN